MNKNYEFAVNTALNELDINRAQARNIRVEKKDGLFYITFSTDWQKYECYIDAGSMEMLGLNFIPYTEDFSDNLEYMVSSVVA